jgi:hypothetical protein
MPFPAPHLPSPPFCTLHPPLPVPPDPGTCPHPVLAPWAPTLPAVPDFCNGRQLRDYQLQSLEWNIRNWWGNVNCILGDEVRVLGLYIGWG